MTGVVIVGAGATGTRCAERLAQRGISVALVGAEAGAPYSRLARSKYLAGDQDAGALMTHASASLASFGVTYRPETRITAIERAARHVTTTSGEAIAYETLVLATGAAPAHLNLPGANLPGVSPYRTIDEVREMIATAASGGRAAVIGGGLLGLEAAAGLARRGMAVTVLHGVDRVMNRQLDHGARTHLSRRLRELGVTVLAPAVTAAIAVKEKVEAVVLSVGRGIQVDDAMRTSDPHIWAIGECTEHRGQCIGLVAPALAQAEVAARAIAGEAACYQPAAAEGTTLKVAGAPVWSSGSIDATPADAIVLEDDETGLYRRRLIQDHRLVAATLLSEIADAPWHLNLIQRGTCAASFREALTFGRAFLPPDHIEMQT